MALFSFVSQSAVVQGQELLRLTPDEAVLIGIDSNPRVSAARAQADEARAVLREVRAERLPTVRADASYSRLTGNIPEVEFTFPGFDSTFTILPVELDRYHSEISVRQPLFGGFTTQHRVQAAASRVQAAMALQAQQEADLALEIRSSYWKLVGAVALRDASGTTRAYVERYVADMENRFAEETVLLRDVLSARTRRSEVRLEGVEAENAVRLARLELNQVLGLPLDTEIQPVIPDPAFRPEIDAVVHAVHVEGHPELQALEDQVRALRREVQAARGTWLPSLSAIARYIYARPNPYFYTDQAAFRGTGEFGLMLQWTPFDGGVVLARTRQASARLAGAEANLAEARKRVAVNRARFQLEAVRTSEALVVAEQHLEEAQETFRVVRHQFAEEAALPADVLEAEQVYRQAMARHARARAEYAIAEAALRHAEGRIW